jgi:hypothetical protein
MTEPKHWTSGQVLDGLRKGPLRGPAFAWLEEVRNQTGYARRERYADALVVSLWPSRGIWFAGIEVKVSRNDWLREIEKPAKSAEIQRFCDFWWVAAPAGIVKLEELPVTWGLYELEGKTVKATRAAPKLEPEPLTQAFVASVLRNQADKLESARAAGRNEGHETASEKFDGEKFDELQRQLTEAERELKRAQQQLEYKTTDLERLRSATRSFERDAGIPDHTIGTYQNNYANSDGAELYRMAQALRQVSRGPVIQSLEQALEGMRNLVKLQETVQEVAAQQENVTQELDQGEEVSV